jgi:hypothetical protein
MAVTSLEKSRGRKVRCCNIARVLEKGTGVYFDGEDHYSRPQSQELQFYRENSSVGHG